MYVCSTWTFHVKKILIQTTITRAVTSNLAKYTLVYSIKYYVRLLTPSFQAKLK